MIPKLPALALGLVLVAATACADPSTDARECIRVEGAEPLLAPGAVVLVGRELNVVLLDREGFPSAQARDALMAERIVEVAHAAAEDVVLSLTGDIHSRVLPAFPGTPASSPWG